MDLLLVLAKLWDFLVYTALPFIVVLGIMIFVHEAGHYLAARLIGVRVLMFKLGFGRYIWSFKRGHTEYGVAWFPIGGYVKMFGDPTEIEGGEEELSLDEIPEAERKEALFFRPAGQKLLVFFAGPFMNILLAFLIAPLVYLIGVEQAAGKKGPQQVDFVESGSPAEKAGILPGDTIISIDGKIIASYRDLRWEEALNPDKDLVYELRRDGKMVEVKVRLRENEKEHIGESGIQPYYPMPAYIDQVIKGSAAEEAGLFSGDTIIEVKGRTLSPWNNIQKAVAESGGKPIELTLLRGGKELKASVSPRFDPEYERLMIGIQYHMVAPDTELVRFPLGKAFIEGSRDCINIVSLTFEVLWKLISFQLSPKTMAGPLGIGAITSEAARSGIPAMIGFMVLISINLGILNLLPFPPLDGGHILFTSVERIIGREIKMKYKEAVFRVGFFLLISLMILVTIQDFFRYKSRMWEFIKEIGKGLGIG